MAFVCFNVGKVLFLAFNTQAHPPMERHAHSLTETRPLSVRQAHCTTETRPPAQSIDSCVHQGGLEGEFLVSSINSRQP